jgi:uncharacterized FlaG/YvyC family protein
MSINPITSKLSFTQQSSDIAAPNAKAKVEQLKPEALARANNVKHDERAQETSADETKAAAQMGLELRVGVLPHTDVILIRFVEPITGEVVREFPPEKLAEALAEIRARAVAHFDRTA